MSDDDPLIRVLQAAPTTGDLPGRTSQDLADALGAGKGTVMRRLKELGKAGRLRVHRGPKLSIDGRMLHTTTYELINESDAD